MAFGWAGSILYVGLTKGKVWREAIPKKMFTEFLDGRGVNAKLIWEMMRQGLIR